MRGKKLTLFPLNVVNQNKTMVDKYKINIELVNNHGKNNNTDRGKRSYQNFITNMLWHSAPPLNNISRNTRRRQCDTEEIKGDQNIELDPKKVEKMETERVKEILPRTTPSVNFKNMLKMFRRKGKLRNYMNRLFNFGNESTYNNYSYKNNNKNFRSDGVSKKKVLVVSVPDSLGELPIIVVKDHKNQMLSLSIQDDGHLNSKQRIANNNYEQSKRFEFPFKYDIRIYPEQNENEHYNQTLTYEQPHLSFHNNHTGDTPQSMLYENKNPTLRHTDKEILLDASITNPNKFKNHFYKLSNETDEDLKHQTLMNQGSGNYNRNIKYKVKDRKKNIMKQIDKLLTDKVNDDILLEEVDI